jgi:hypothetical protein
MFCRSMEPRNPCRLVPHLEFSVIRECSLNLKEAIRYEVKLYMVLVILNVGSSEISKGYNGVNKLFWLLDVDWSGDGRLH